MQVLHPFFNSLLPLDADARVAATAAALPAICAAVAACGADAATVPNPNNPNHLNGPSQQGGVGGGRSGGKREGGPGRGGVETDDPGFQLLHEVERLMQGTTALMNRVDGGARTTLCIVLVYWLHVLI